jgi:hypothetical protein
MRRPRLPDAAAKLAAEEQSDKGIGKPRAFLMAAVLLFMAAVIASILPAHRAAPVDPLVVLREE